jgi:sulfur carrier protein
MAVLYIPCRPEHGRHSPIAIAPVKLSVNGNLRELADGSTVAALLEDLELAGKFVAVEVNLELVPKAQHTDRVLSDGDRVEIVTLVGGG